MSRKPEPPLAKIARHLHPQLDPPELDVFLQSEEDTCLNWNGQFKPNKNLPPVKHELPPIGTTGYNAPRIITRSRRQRKPYSSAFQCHPVRVLAAHLYGPLDPLVHMTNTCGNPDCVNPHHFKFKATTSLFEERTGVPPRISFDEDEVQSILELLNEGEPLDEIVAHPLDIEEAKRRCKNFSTEP